MRWRTAAAVHAGGQVTAGSRFGWKIVSGSSPETQDFRIRRTILAVDDGIVHGARAFQVTCPTTLV